MNPADFRADLALKDRDRRSQERLESKTPSFKMIPPKRRVQATLADYIQANPELKRSKALKQVQEAYFEAIKMGQGLIW